MGQERTLWQRLNRPRQTRGPSDREDTNRLIRSIFLNLQRILNAGKGHALAQPDLGLPPPSEVTHAVPDAIGLMQKVIRDCIEKFEPRIAGVDVSYVETEDEILTLRFQITAQLTTSRNRQTVVFDTLVDSAGHIKLAN